ncbi:sensory transduction histidine kinase [Methanosarcina horonobensis HB-1 = JCM 15518]|uniref:Sensory transduction histidine kinase n=1 Tax=Methanosarcina horonobensis HB-1 = JCM 15518 TaxID=1434110 RepID=A0A0E3S849_9EURY|nr:sensory transduction histidine kinase [Methanosarcina horonobensis HB-1 = JCM 15518]
MAKDRNPMSYQALLDKNHALEAEIQDLRIRLEEAEELKRAISEGDLDALVISRPGEELIFTLDSADRAYRVLVETMNEGTATLACDGTILYCNRHFAELMRMSFRDIIGTSIHKFIAPEDATTFKALLKLEKGMGEVKLQGEDKKSVPVYLSVSSLKTEGSPNAWCLVATDLTEQKKSEEIVAAERLARSIIEQAVEAIVVCDTSGRIIRFSNAVPILCEYNPMFQSFEDIIDLRFSEGEDAGKSILPVSSALKGDTILGMETTLELKRCQNSHEKLHLFLNSGPLKNSDGRIIGCVVTLADITERKVAETKLKNILDNLEKLVKERTAELEKAYNSLKESERVLAEAQKMAHLGSWYRDFITDKVYWSDETYRIFGLEPQEFEVTFDSFLRYVHPEDQDYVENNVKKALKGEPYSNDCRIISANGTERMVHTQGEVIFDEKKTPIGMRGAIQDITEQKLAIEKIKESEERVQLYLQNFMGIGTQLDGNFVPVFLHGAVEELTGYTKEDFLSGKVRWSEIVVPEDRAGLQEKAQKMKNTPSMTVRHEYRIRKKDGEVRWIHGIAQNISESGNKELYQGMMYDITDRKIAEESLEKMDKIRIKEIHHRIKNNLQVICSLLSLEADKFSDEKMLEAFRESQNRVASMALIHEELYRGDKNDALDFAAYLRKFASDLFSSYNLGNNVSLRMDLEQAYLDMDTAIPLGIIVNELISNSLKHAFPAGSKGEICINLQRTETFAARSEMSSSDEDCREENGFQYILRVVDNGKGIPEEIDFQNADSLGLQLINILVEQIDGYVELKRDRGTEFAILFGNKEA